MNNRTLLAILVCASLAPPGTAAAQAITVGATSSTSDAPIFIADKKGYFREEGLEVKVVNFRSAADMVAPLGAGQLEAGAGSASAGLYNAVARGIRIKIVADKASSPPGYGGTKILVRKDHVDSGRYKSLKDLKGMKFAMNAPGVSNTFDAQHPVEVRWAEIFRCRDRRHAVARPRRGAQEQIGRCFSLGGAGACARRSRR